MSKTDYTLWPNAGGTLGQNKVEIPDGVTTLWPDGDALVDNFIYKDGKLVGFVDTKALINNSSKSSNIPYDYVRLHLENIDESDITFTLGERCKKFNVSYGSVSDTGNSGNTVVTLKYKGCTTVDEVKAVDPDYLTNDVVDGAWTEGLGDLEDGNSMFYGCLALETFESDLSSLTDSYCMFNNCENLESFSSDLPSLTGGESMFYECRQLTTFSSDLSSLTDGYFMFYNCKLNTASVQNIAYTINTPTNKGTIYIGIGNTTPNEQEEEAFNTIASRNWTVYVNGYSSSDIWTPTTTTPIDGEQTVTPIPFWAKPVQSDEQHAHYVDSEGNYYNILGGNFIYGDSLETYGMFISEEDAAANMRLKRIGKE